MTAPDVTKVWELMPRIAELKPPANLWRDLCVAVNYDPDPEVEMNVEAPTVGETWRERQLRKTGVWV